MLDNEHLNSNEELEESTAEQEAVVEESPAVENLEQETDQQQISASETENSNAEEEIVYQEIDNSTLDSILESFLFISEKPVQKKGIHEILREINPEQIDTRLEALCEKYTGDGFELVKINQGYQFRTNPNNSEYLLRLHETKPVRLSRGNLETLAIVAYRQPITRPEIDEIRGVDSGHMLRTLLERNLIKILGKREEAGNPLIYGTTADFLEFFQLDNLSDLPSLTEYTELGEESLEKLEKLLPKSVNPEDISQEGSEEALEQESVSSENLDNSDQEGSEEAMPQVLNDAATDSADTNNHEL